MQSAFGFWQKLSEKIKNKIGAERGEGQSRDGGGGPCAGKARGRRGSTKEGRTRYDRRFIIGRTA